jgi:hypothetical protein
MALDAPVVATGARRLASCRGATMLGVSPGFVPVGELTRSRSTPLVRSGATLCLGAPNGEAAWAGGCAT